MRSQLCRCDGTLTRFCMFRNTQFHERYQPAEILITSSSTSQDGYRYNRLSKIQSPKSKVLPSTLDIGRWTLDFYSVFGTYLRLHSNLLCGQIYSSRPV